MSAGLQPYGGEPDGYATTDSLGSACIVRRNGALETAVAGDRDVELRRLTLAHHGNGIRTLEVTSSAELVLGSAAGEIAIIMPPGDSADRSGSRLRSLEGQT